MTAPPVTPEECLIALLRLFDRIDAGEVHATSEQRHVLREALDALMIMDLWGSV
jgi:hypothetical protein